MDLIRWRQVLPLYLCFVLAFPLGMAWVETRPLDGPTLCAFRLVTHLDCPSCGLTRAFRAMGRLDVPAAFRYNPLGPALFLLALALWGYAVAALITRGRVGPPGWWRRWSRMLMYGGLAVYLLAGIGRIIYEVHHPPPPPRAWSQIGWPGQPSDGSQNNTR